VNCRSKSNFAVVNATRRKGVVINNANREVKWGLGH